MRRMLMLLTAALVMAAMMAASGMPAFAKINDFSSGSPGNSNLDVAGSAGGGGPAGSLFSDPLSGQTISRQGNAGVPHESSAGDDFFTPGRCSTSFSTAGCVGQGLTGGPTLP